MGSGRSGYVVALLIVPCLLASTVAMSGAQAAFPGGNGKIAFAGSFEDGADPPDVYTFDPNDIAGPINLTDDSSAADLEPSWSPDGTKLAFASNSGGPFQIFVMDADGTDRAPLTSGAAFRRAPAWSPDGTRIAYYGDSPTGNNIFVMNANGTSQQQLTFFSGNSDPMPPAWSPNGSKIAFHKVNDDEDTIDFVETDIFVMNADGSGHVNLTAGTVWENVDPSWSPDGTKLAFSSDRTDDSRFSIFTMNANGTGGASLVSDGGRDPAWSPDGSKIALSCGVLCILDLASSDERSIETVETIRNIDWQSIPSQREASTITVAGRASATKVRISGTVTPAHAGHVVNVSLTRKKNGRFVPVGSKDVPLSETSAYVASFKFKANGTCKATASFAGDADHLESQAFKTFKC